MVDWVIVGAILAIVVITLGVGICSYFLFQTDPESAIECIANFLTGIIIGIVISLPYIFINLKS